MATPKELIDIAWGHMQKAPVAVQKTPTQNITLADRGAVVRFDFETVLTNGVPMRRVMGTVGDTTLQVALLEVAA